MNHLTSDDEVELMREANRLRFERPHDAHRLYAKAVECCREAGMRRELIRALKGLGQIERDSDNGAAALALYEGSGRALSPRRRCSDVGPHC